MNRISVIIPTYQHAKTIAQCIGSLLSQTRLPDEIIVIDDGSTDDTESKLSEYTDQIKYIKQSNSGAQSARMNGFKQASGDLLLFCDADVVARPDMLEKLEKALREHSEASYAYASFMWGPKLFKSKEFDKDALKEMNFIHTTALIRKEDFPGFDLEVKRFQDWDLWLTMLEQGHVGVFVNEVLFQIIHEGGRIGISNWLPSFIYKIPWRRIGWMPQSVKDYMDAKKVIEAKHRL